MFEILVSGIPRTYRDRKDMAVAAARVLKQRDVEIIIIDQTTKEWTVVNDLVSEPKWQPPVQA
jgi:predicted methyltransferase MtxX (methanogen marker protein 4)